MTAPRAPSEIVADRLRVVLALTEANALHHRARAQVGGAEIEAMRVAERLRTGAGGSVLEAERDASRARDAEVRAALAEAEAELGALEDALARLDRELMDAQSGKVP